MVLFVIDDDDDDDDGNGVRVIMMMVVMILIAMMIVNDVAHDNSMTIMLTGLRRLGMMVAPLAAHVFVT